jgi:Carboxypeptidase regulatory-like domain
MNTQPWFIVLPKSLGTTAIPLLGRIAFLAFLVLSCLSPARAQVSGSITGIVTDASGAPVPATVVETKNLETGSIRTATTDDAGRYLVLSLPVGEYEVTASKSGFQDAIHSGIQLVVNQEANIALRLQVTAVKSEVTVRGDAPMVSTTTLDISGLVGERAVKELPLNGRSDHQHLHDVAPGAVRP